MVRRGRSTTKNQVLKPSSAPPDPQTDPVSNVENIYLNDTTSDETFLDKRYPSNGKTTAAVYRRSKRLKTPPPEPSRDVQPDAEEVDAVETDKGVELPFNTENDPPQNTKDVPEKSPPTDQEKSVEVVDLNYRKMYIDTHKKVKTLTKKNRILRKKLERALGKIEAYDELTPTLSSLSKANQILSTRPWTKTKGFRT